MTFIGHGSITWTYTLNLSVSLSKYRLLHTIIYQYINMVIFIDSNIPAVPVSRMDGYDRVIPRCPAPCGRYRVYRVRSHPWDLNPPVGHRGDELGYRGPAFHPNGLLDSAGGWEGTVVAAISPGQASLGLYLRHGRYHLERHLQIFNLSANPRCQMGRYDEVRLPTYIYVCIYVNVYK